MFQKLVFSLSPCARTRVFTIYILFLRYILSTEAIPWELKQIFDKSVQIKQIDVCEQMGIMFFLNDRGRIYAIKLTEFNQILNESNLEPKTRVHCKDYKLEIIHGCNFYTMSNQFLLKPAPFKFVAVCSKRLLIVELKASQNLISPDSEEVSNIYNQSDSNGNYELELTTNSLFYIKKVTFKKLL